MPNRAAIVALAGRRIDAGDELFTYMRYIAELTRKGLDELELGDIVPTHVQALDSVAHMDDLTRVGQAVGLMQVRRAHFEGFV